MAPMLDIILVILAVVSAAAYLLRRKFASSRAIARDWSSGHAESCPSCPVMEIRRKRV